MGLLHAFVRACTVKSMGSDFDRFIQTWENKRMGRSMIS